MSITNKCLVLNISYSTEYVYFADMYFINFFDQRDLGEGGRMSRSLPSNRAPFHTKYSEYQTIRERSMEFTNCEDSIDREEYFLGVSEAIRMI